MSSANDWRSAEAASVGWRCGGGGAGAAAAAGGSAVPSTVVVRLGDCDVRAEGPELLLRGAAQSRCIPNTWCAHNLFATLHLGGVLGGRVRCWRRHYHRVLGAVRCGLRCWWCFHAYFVDWGGTGLGADFWGKWTGGTHPGGYIGTHPHCTFFCWEPSVDTALTPGCS